MDVVSRMSTAWNWKVIMNGGMNLVDVPNLENISLPHSFKDLKSKTISRIYSIMFQVIDRNSPLS